MVGRTVCLLGKHEKILAKVEWPKGMRVFELVILRGGKKDHFLEGFDSYCSALRVGSRKESKTYTSLWGSSVFGLEI